MASFLTSELLQQMLTNINKVQQMAQENSKRLDKIEEHLNLVTAKKGDEK